MRRFPWLSGAIILSLTIIADLGGGPYAGAVTFWGFFLLFGGFMGLCWLCGQSDIFFTIVKEGTGKNVLRGGDFHHTVISFRDHHVNEPGTPWYIRSLPDWQVLPNDTPDPEGKAKAYADHRPWFMRVLGLHWLGIIPGVYAIHKYHFQWNELDISSSGGERVRQRNTRDEGHPTDFFYLSDFTYVFLLEGAETVGNFPVNVITQVTVAIENGYKAFFKGEDWLLRLGAAVNGTARRFVGTHNFDELHGVQTPEATEGLKGAKRDLGEEVTELNDRLEGEDITAPGNHGTCGRYGVRIRAVDVQDIILSDDKNHEMRDALQREALAQINKRVKITESEGQAQAMRNLGQAEADSLKSRLDVLNNAGSVGPLLAQLDAMATATEQGKTIIWANNPFVSQVGGLADLLQKAGMAPDELASMLRNLKEQPQGQTA